MTALELLPAVDVADGQAVRLVQGEAGSETSYGDPVDAALQWQRDGAEWVHLVDLDAAFGRGHNRDVIREIVAKMDIKVELSGGIRDDESLESALATGCTRVNIGTAALEHPEWCSRIIGQYGDRIAIGLDVRGTTASGTDGHDTAQRILRDLASHAFGQSPHFTIGVPGKDLPARFAWRLEVVPVP